MRGGGGVEFDGQKFFQCGVAIRGGVRARAGDEEHRAAEFLHELLERAEVLGRESARLDVADDDEIELEQVVLFRGHLREEGRRVARGDALIAFEQHAFQIHAPVAQQHALHVAEFPARRGLDVENLYLGIDHAQPLRDGVVVLRRLVGARRDAGAQLEVAGRLRRERHGHHGVLVVAECDVLRRDDLAFAGRVHGHEAHGELRAFALQPLAAHADGHGQFVFHKRDLLREQAADDDVARRRDADAVDVKRDALLLREARGVERRGAVVVRAVGDEEDARERLAALALDEVAHGVADGGGGGDGIEVREPRGKRGCIASSARIFQIHAEAERGEIEFLRELRPELELFVAEHAAHDFDAGDELHVCGERGVERLVEALGRIENALRDGRALEVSGVHARVLDFHAAARIHEREQRAPDRRLDRERHNRPQQQQAEQRKEHDAQRSEHAAFSFADHFRRIAPIRKPSEHRERDADADDPAEPLLVAEDKLRAAHMRRIFHPEAAELQERVGHSAISKFSLTGISRKQWD